MSLKEATKLFETYGQISDLELLKEAPIKQIVCKGDAFGTGDLKEEASLYGRRTESCLLALAEWKKQLLDDIALREQLEADRRQGEEELSQNRTLLGEQEKELEPHFATIVAALVEKLTGAVCKSKKDVIVHLIDNALRNLEKSKRIVLRVSKADIAMVSSKRGAFLKELKEGTELEITEDNSLSANQCIIETDNKIVDCSLDAQLDSLREQIKMIAM